MTNVRIMASSSVFLELQHRLPRTDVMAVVGLLLWLFLLLCHAGGVCPDIIAFVSHFFTACCELIFKVGIAMILFFCWISLKNQG